MSNPNNLNPHALAWIYKLLHINPENKMYTETDETNPVTLLPVKNQFDPV